MGLSTESKNTGMAGSKFWCAPEMIKKLKYDSKVDVWSLGALTYEVKRNCRN
jgi:serine/threonine protein kinase